MRVVEPLDTLELDNDLVFDQQVGPKALLELESLVCDRNCNLPFNLQAPLPKRVRENNFIDRLQQTGANLPMNPYRNVNDLLPNRIFRHSSPSLGVPGVLAREKKDLRKLSEKNVPRRPIFFHAHHTLGARYEPADEPFI